MGKATQARTTPTIHFKSLISPPDDGYVLPEFGLDCVYVRFGGNRIVEGFGHGGNNGLSLGDVKSSGLEVAARFQSVENGGRHGVLLCLEISTLSQGENRGRC